MVIVRMMLNVMPEKRLEFTQMLLSMMEPIRKEMGCMYNALSCDIKDNNCFKLIEEWETREDLNKHFESHRFGVLLGSKSLLSKPFEITLYTVSKIERMKTVNFVRESGKKEL